MEILTLVTGAGDSNQNPDSDGLSVLISQLQLAHLQVGKPPYRQIARTCGLSASTICRIFKKTDKPPSWDNLERVLRALDIDPDTDTTWRKLWLNAVNSTKPITVVELDDDKVVPGRRSCNGCGTWIADDTTHDRYHQHIDELTLLVGQLRRQIADLSTSLQRSA